MGKNIIRSILIILLLGTFGLIFGFSNQDSKQSGGLSEKVTQMIFTQNKDEIFLEKAETLIRKLAHFSIYTIVGILIMALMSTYPIEEKNRIAITLITGIIYASSDEIHQLFIPGRSGQITDIIIDTMGVTLGCLLVLLLFFLKHDTKRQVDKKETKY